MNCGTLALGAIVLESQRPVVNGSYRDRTPFRVSAALANYHSYRTAGYMTLYKTAGDIFFQT